MARVLFSLILCILFGAPAGAQQIYLRQQGSMAPGNLPCVFSDYVVNDCGGAVVQIQFPVLAVDFNATGDTALPIQFPARFTRFLVAALRISGCTASITSATFDLRTASGGGGSSLLSSSPTTGTVSTASDATNNNAQTPGIVNSGAESYVAANLAKPNTLYFRIVSAEGSPVTCNVAPALLPQP